MNRRDFLLKVTALCTVIVVPMVVWLRWAKDTGVIRALRGRLYPGPIRPLDKESVGRRGKWAG